jgi:hypothetical protein
MTNPDVTDEQLRGAGYTAKARNYPMSQAAVRWLAKFSGVAFEKVPAAWWYAPNPDVLKSIEERAAECSE